ncbi:MAG: helix-turn-helix domain-containing protein [Allorhizobium sp.]
MNTHMAAETFPSSLETQQASGRAHLVSTISAGGIVISRLQSDRHDLEELPITPRTEAFDVSVQLHALETTELWRRGTLVTSGGFEEAALTIADLTDDWKVHHHSPFDMLRFHIPFLRLNGFVEEAGRPLFMGLSCPPGQRDPVMFGLAQALLPSLENPHQANLLFVERINLAVLAHLSQTYGGVFFPLEKKGTLAPWQERRVKDYLDAHFHQTVAVADLAETCELSRSYFIKAFKESFGRTPYRWLSEYRVARARDMLLGDTSIAEIAIDCGFADQSHMTRIFAEYMGLAPGQFRRQNRPDLP